MHRHASHGARNRAGVTMKSSFAIVSALLLAGCASDVASPPPSKVTPPSARLMADPARLPALKAGDDLVVEDLKLRRQYLKETARLRSLQNYIRIRSNRHGN